MFLWDHVLRPEREPREIADVWVALAAVASATERVRLGPMVTPLARRRPNKVAREIVTLDLLSGGRLVCGFGLGDDHYREFSAHGDVVDRRERAEMFDEGLGLLDELLRGEEVNHRGPHYVADRVVLRPLPEQRPRPPFWLAARGGAPVPTRRAARFEGLFPIELGAEELAASLALVATERGGLEGFDVAVVAVPGRDLAPYEEAGATWAMHVFSPGATADDLRRRAASPPPGGDR
ncbi:MAG: LLM class flavin-dependent oxidoreductase [Acidimicrobiia bacterium]|nr:LLM class flavin-dependent oxidoreductase [Acidimicrobiia bacterium]